MKRALILTVGTGARSDVFIVKPLIKTVRDSRPDFTVFVVSGESHKNAQAIAVALGLEDEGATAILKENSADGGGATESASPTPAQAATCRIVSLENPEDFDSVFRAVNRIFRELLRCGYTPDDIQLDFTSGTKAMTAGAALSAVYNQCASLKYITGERRNGLVMDDTERFLSIEPKRILRLYDMKVAVNLIHHLRFDAALEILKEIKEQILDSEEAQELAAMRRLAEAYLAWELFSHGAARKDFAKLPPATSHCAAYLPTPAIIKHLEHLTEKDGDSSGARLCDLFNNGRRRAQEGKYDDAVARLYRAVELCAQNRLGSQYGIQTGDVDLGKVPVGPYRESLSQCYDAGDGKTRIGLFRAYELLDVLGDPLGVAFRERKTMAGRIKKRNNSILAHGTDPVSDSLCGNLLKDAAALFEAVRPGFMEYADRIQFPWLKKGDVCGIF